ncbi:ciliary neurotrophic factor [Puntigrus tetrazona]|uniref:ciliary neurotrophic factor n=1 Tax=Puntigrus tetrazona TaxID=1606681 RepID=UPI001C89E448|nr:ciliary neurotrophic factor [Puntigrus tetrazona]XP_043094366.1 ciliary neurotrophic factor [Puntigrus tetrazona]
MAGRSANGRHGLRGHAGRTAALARLVHKECIQLLEIYRNSESLPSLPADGGYLVSIPPLVPQLSDAEKISILHAALKESLRLLEDVITREDAEFSGEDSEYKRKQKTVRDRLGHLLASTEQLLVDGQRFEAEVKEELDGQAASGAFGLKMWIVRVLQDLVHWTGQTSETLHSMPAETEKAPKTRSLRTRRGAGKIRK